MTSPTLGQEVSEGDYFGQLLDAVLPAGNGVVALIYAYFDESGTHEGDHRMVVAGYLFKAQQAKNFSSRWGKVLAQSGLECFSASDCASGGKDFRLIPVEKRDALTAQLIALIRQRMEYGIAVTMRAKDYDAAAPEGWHDFYGHAYTTCLQYCLAEVSRWADQTKYHGPIAYFFESGHRHQGEANVRMNQMAQKPADKAALRYVSHTFIDKRVGHPCDAADYLAWNVYRFLKFRLPADDAPITESPPDKLTTLFMTLIDGHWQRGLYKLRDVHQGELTHLFATQPPPPRPTAKRRK